MITVTVIGADRVIAKLKRVYPAMLQRLAITVNACGQDLAGYIKANFEVLQLNIIGSRKVTDFDGAEMSEKELAAKYGVRFTPTFQFFAERAAPLKGLAPAKREVARAPGYLRPDDFLAMFRFVREKAYETKSFRDFVKALPS